MAGSHKNLHWIRIAPGSSEWGQALRKAAQHPESLISCEDPTLLASLNALLPDREALSITQLARRAAIYVGKDVPPSANRPLIERAVAEACHQQADGLFRAAEDKPGAHRAIQRTLSELREWMVTPGDLRHAAKGAGAPSPEKLLQLAALDEDVRARLAALGRGKPKDPLVACLESSGKAAMKLPPLVLVAHRPPTPLLARFIKRLADLSTRVTVLQAYAPGNEALYATRLPTDVTEKLLADSRRLPQALFHAPAAADPELDVRLTVAHDAMLEVETTLRAIRRDLEAGADCGDIAIVARQTDVYAPLFAAFGPRFGVPLRLRRRAPLASSGVAREVRNWLAALVSHEPHDFALLARRLAHPLDGEQTSTIDEHLANAMRDHRDSWGAVEKALAGIAVFPGPRLLKTIQWRREAMSQSWTVGEWIRLLTQFPPAAPKWIDEADPEGAPPEPTEIDERDARAISVMRQELSALASLGSDARRFSLPAFFTQARAIWAHADVSIPDPSRGVPVCSIGGVLLGADNLYVLGMHEGSFPSHPSEDPILSDRDRMALSSALALDPPLPTFEDRMSAEREAFHGACSAARKKLILSRPLTEGDTTLVSSYFLVALENARSGLVEKNEIGYLDLADAEGCAADRALAVALEGPRYPEELGALTAPGDPLLAMDAEFAPRELAEANTCGFRYYARRRLNIAPERTASLWAQLVRRVPTNAKPWEIADEDQIRPALTQALDEFLDSIRHRVRSWEFDLLNTAANRLIDRWTHRELATRRLWGRKPATDAPRWIGDAPSVATFVPPGDGLGRPRGETVRLSGPFPPMSSLGRCWVFHHFLTQDPTAGSSSWGSDDSDSNPLRLEDPHLTEYGLTAAALRNPARELNVVFEIDSPSNRSFLVLWPASAGRIGPKARDIRDESWAKTKHIGEMTSEWLTEVYRRAANGRRRIVDSDATPCPGDHCASCPYGEICRRHLDYGYRDSPFGDGLPRRRRAF